MEAAAAAAAVTRGRQEVEERERSCWMSGSIRVEVKEERNTSLRDDCMGASEPRFRLETTLYLISRYPIKLIPFMAVRLI